MILAAASGWSPSYGGLGEAMAPHGVRIFLFGKPEAHPDRRLGVVVARAASTDEARVLARTAAHIVESKIRMDSPKEP